MALSASGKKHDLSIGRITREGKRENSLPSIESWFFYSDLPDIMHARLGSTEQRMETILKRSSKLARVA